MHQPTLKHFLLRQKTLALYRHAIRASQAISDPGARKETVEWVRCEIERNRHVTDVRKIEDLVQQGRRDLKQIFPGR
ncbi:hypothetical protein BDZ89DRAFT_942765 [Hymenopellis radicata]|nr:hypothetical protein BDZ89DRAFT_942765 [Hymenopellis radicata]